MVVIRELREEVPTNATELTDEERKEAIYKILTDPLFFVLWAIFAVIFIGIYFVCREGKKGKKKKNNKMQVSDLTFFVAVLTIQSYIIHTESVNFKNDYDMKFRVYSI